MTLTLQNTFVDFIPVSNKLINHKARLDHFLSVKSLIPAKFLQLKSLPGQCSCLLCMNAGFNVKTDFLPLVCLKLS